MVYRMVHPDHGVHICYSDAEVATCRKNGWKLESEVKKVVKKAARKKHDESGIDQ